MTARRLDCDVDGLEPTLGSIDALARVQLAARRSGLELRLRHASRELLGLIDLVGLTDALPATDDFSCPWQSYPLNPSTRR
jgi:hypothetical protein